MRLHLSQRPRVFFGVDRLDLWLGAHRHGLWWLRLPSFIYHQLTIMGLSPIKRQLRIPYEINSQNKESGLLYQMEIPPFFLGTN